VEDIPDRMRAARDAQRLSARELGARLGEKEQRIRDIENRRQRCPAELLARLAAELRVRPAWLLTGEGPMHEPEPIAAPSTAQWPEPVPRPVYAVQEPRPPPVVDERLSQLRSELEAWWARAGPDERVWLAVELRRRYPEIWSGRVAS
jgi:transcriptional regulator with XRE-family HTH domain